MHDSEEVKGWLKKAEADFHGAIDIHRRRKKPLPDLVCYHSQQAAEKYLKAFSEGFYGVVSEKPA